MGQTDISALKYTLVAFLSIPIQLIVLSGVSVIRGQRIPTSRLSAFFSTSFQQSPLSDQLASSPALQRRGWIIGLELWKLHGNQTRSNRPHPCLWEPEFAQEGSKKRGAGHLARNHPPWGRSLYRKRGLPHPTQLGNTNLEITI